MTRWRSTVGKILYLAAAVVVFLGAVSVSEYYGIEVRVHKLRRVDPATSYTPPYRSATGPQLVMIYFGSSECGGANAPKLPEAVETLKLRLSKYAAREGVAFTAIGVSLDWLPKRGIEYLSKFGTFDEVSAGYNWGNSLALRYMWAEDSVAPVTPQVVLYERRFTTPVDSGGASRDGC